MVSPTSKTEAKRRRKHKAGGKARKREEQKQGSTPKFPIHPEGNEKGRSKPQPKGKSEK